jgi:hypothetical protein
MNLFLIGFVAGIVIWLLWKVPLIAGLVIGLFVLCLLLARFRLVTAFVIGLLLGFS